MPTSSSKSTVGLDVEVRGLGGEAGGLEVVESFGGGLEVVGGLGVARD